MEPWCTYSLAKLPPLLFLEGRWKRRNENPWRGKIISISIWPNFRQPVQHVLDFSWSHGFIKQQGVYEMIAYCTTKNKNMKIYQSCWQDLTKVIILSYFFFFFSPLYIYIYIFFNFIFWEREREKRRDGTGKRKKFGKKMRLKKKTMGEDVPWNLFDPIWCFKALQSLDTIKGILVGKKKTIKSFS